MPTIKAKVLGGQPLFDIASYGRRGPQRRDRLSPGEIATISRTVHRAPEVMVKVLAQGATSRVAVARHLGYLGREGKLALETDEGERIQGKDSAEELIDQWNLDLEEHRRSLELSARRERKSRLVHKLMFSMPAGTDPEALRRAAKQFLCEEFSKRHRHAFVLHTDAPHPHVHAVVKAVNEQGVRLHIDKQMLRRWREAFAVRLREAGVEANATERAVRGQTRVSKKDAVYRATRRGASTHMTQRIQEVLKHLSRGSVTSEPGRARMLKTRREVEAGWHALARTLAREGHPRLAEDVDRFIHQMPPARTEKERIIYELLSRAHANRSKGRTPTR